ncbi:MAG TPA: hypothetical protein VGQ46_09750 [Thermoanaerobaculia bacterium]|jgi:hypothetical protein|nr:hypothetical protein [Thermoanaerobaculia bacterium]
MKRLSLTVLFLFAGSLSVHAACTPCTPAYALTVHYTLNGSPQTGTLNGTVTIIDGALDANVASVQSLLTAQAGAGAVLTDVVQIALNGAPGALAGQNDTLVAANGDVVAWVDNPNGPAGHLHFTTLLTHPQVHSFDYTYSAAGTESPPIAFDYTLAASGQETFRTPAHLEQRVSIDKYDPNKAECKEVEGDACLPVGSKRTSSRLDEYSSSPQIVNSFADAGDRCSHYHIKVSSTGVLKKMCNDSKAYNCSLCGAWYEGIAVLDGFADAQRPWTRSITGAGSAEGKPKTDFTVNYATAGGALGSGAPDTTALFGSPSFAAAFSNCKAGTTPIPCNNLGTSIAGNTLTVSTVYTQAVGTSKSASSTLKSTDGVKTIDTLAFLAENGDVRHTVVITYQGTVYRDNNGDGFVDVGPFSFWTGGNNNDQLLGAFDRSGFPSATIDSIVPNPALLAQTVQFTGHGTGPFTNYGWFTHRLDQPGGTLLGTTATFSRTNLAAGLHQIRFAVAGVNPSPFTYATLTVNQPPIAFVNHIENTNDPVHPTTALLLHGGAQTDAFDFDGGGIDFDGTVASFEWSSDIEPGHVLGTTAHLQKSLTALGTHTISFRVRDNAGVWSAPVKQTVVVRWPPVLLIHGLCGDNSSWDEVVNNNWLGPQWTTADIVRRTFDANGDGVTNDAPADNAVLVWQQIQQMKQTFDTRTVDILDHSMGGLDARAYIQGIGYQGDINKLVMLATPNHGSTIADMALISNGYSETDVELFIPIPGVKTLLQTLGIIVDIVDWADPLSGLACLGQDSPALHALRPHSAFLRNLNHTSRDDGTEDFGDSGLPADFVPDTQAFVIFGERATVSHVHLPDSMVKTIKTATLGQVDLANMSLLWARPGDGVVTARSAQLDGIPSDHFDHRHRQMEKKADSVGKGLFYLLDDPPQAAARTIGGPAPISGAHLLGAGRATVQSMPAATLSVDTAAQRLRVSVTWAQTGRTFSQQPGAPVARIGIQPLPLLVLTRRAESAFRPTSASRASPPRSARTESMPQSSSRRRAHGRSSSPRREDSCCRVEVSRTHGWPSKRAARLSPWGCRLRA